MPHSTERAAGMPVSGKPSKIRGSYRFSRRADKTGVCAQKEPANLFNNCSITPFARHLPSRKLLHMNALSGISRGLAIKMKIAHHASIGAGYGPIGRKYWTTNSLAFTLKVSIWNGSLGNPRSHGRVAENGLAACQSSKGIRKFRV